jgi:hypothetical protein
MNYKIVDDILNKENQDKLETYLLSSNFPWFLNHATSFGKTELDKGLMILDNNTNDNFQFTHSFFDQEPKPYFKLIVPFLNYIKDNLGFKEFEFDRIKSNLLINNPQQPLESYNVPHVDGQDDNTKTLLYYVNDSDGDTVFFNEKYGDNINNLTTNMTLSPKKGTAIIFNSNYFHSSRPPINNKFRCVINLVFRSNKNLIS